MRIFQSFQLKAGGFVYSHTVATGQYRAVYLYFAFYEEDVHSGVRLVQVIAQLLSGLDFSDGEPCLLQQLGGSIPVGRYDERKLVLVQIGADVPYCIMRGTALAEGIGEALSPLPQMVKCPVLIAKPSISVSTKFVYQNLKLDDTTIHPDIDRLIDDIKAKNLHDIAAHMGNVLETVTIPAYPVIADIKDHMMEHGAVNAMMSGSGPTVFGLFDDEDTAKKAYKAMRSSHLARQVYLTSVYNNRK